MNPSEYEKIFNIYFAYRYKLIGWALELPYISFLDNSCAKLSFRYFILDINSILKHLFLLNINQLNIFVLEPNSSITFMKMKIYLQ